MRRIIYDIKRYPDKTAGTPFFVTKNYLIFILEK